MLEDTQSSLSKGSTVKSPTRAVAVLGVSLLAISLAGCAANTATAPESTSSVPAPATPPGTPDAPATGDSAPSVSTEHNDADVTYAQMMTIHHEGALEMAELATRQADSDDVKDVAATIEAAQGPEIALMQSWLTSWGEPLEPSGHAGMDHGGMDMDGKSQEDVMAELQKKTGTDFDDQFLSSMIAHHEGAVVMSKEELTAGNNPEAIDLAQLIIDAQQSEISQMQQLLNNL